MKSTGSWKHFVWAFAIALVLYVIAYTFIENRRTRNGPWQVSFIQENAGPPTLIIDEPKLNITNVRIAFPNKSSTRTNAIWLFSRPKQVPFDVPFGSCIFEDTTFQPGTVVFNAFGHEIQLIPRTLTIDGKEYPWKSESTLTLTNRGILLDPAKPSAGTK
ncbi:MAG: hypothetical protein JWR69_235 [Pedosphaera sp.]|nr:hypothetical protein [Pedosphaera sp.]